MNDVVIFGAGLLGDFAYKCFFNQCNFICYVDNNARLWGKTLNGISIQNPDILRKHKYAVLIASTNYEKEIKRQLYQKYGIVGAMVLQTRVTNEELDDDDFLSQSDELIVSFCGGLGNQMFQYVIYKIFQLKGKKVRADLSYYIKAMWPKDVEKNVFSLTEAFPNISIQRNTPAAKRYYLQHKYDRPCNGVCSVIQEPKMQKNVFDSSWILAADSGIVQGYFQTFKYPRIVENALRKEFVFTVTDFQLQAAINEIESNNSIGIHVRKFTEWDTDHIFGNYCGRNYYSRAIKYFKERVENPKFCFFCYDIQYAKQHYHEEDAMYISSSMFEAYEDWYDMCLMSRCKHNIIANSTFGWWGAWLNQNPEKIVVAPRQWMKEDIMHDICPPEWVRL